MRRIQENMHLEEEPRPVDYFELAAGTSTGGIIGILLFRFRMTATEAIETYDEIAKDVFKPKIYGFSIDFLPEKVSSFINNSKTVFQNSRFDGASLESAVHRVVEKHGLDKEDKRLRGDTLLQHPEAGKFKRHHEGQPRQITISIATRATSAAPTYFPEIKWPEGQKETLTFWDGGLLNNNPVDQLWYSRYDLVQPGEPDPEISCVISLGTGWIKADSPSNYWFNITGVLSTVVIFSTNTNAKAKDFTRHMTTLNNSEKYAKTKYVRFNPSLKNENIGLADYHKMDLLKSLAREYVNDPKTYQWIEKAVEAICPKSS
ncbi:hypothetical protein CSUB01_11284 [Colletotrichum sublineola]|uniref:PNPLA domain-containing protein n=1 Tax=Colletotrichum sublineola TaxID=1173701 RepID=A0A066WUJ5_COLSU|nr:hypothetical protein CSUB01_11284 [Colletotrichum sublineola]